jgi:hypothetical protein
MQADIVAMLGEPAVKARFEPLGVARSLARHLLN